MTLHASPVLTQPEHFSCFNLVQKKAATKSKSMQVLRLLMSRITLQTHLKLKSLNFITIFDVYLYFIKFETIPPPERFRVVVLRFLKREFYPRYCAKSTRFFHIS